MDLYTSKQICKEFKITSKTLENIVKYLKLDSIQKYHEKAHKVCSFYTEEQFEQIRQFLINTPNKKALFMKLSKIEKYGSLENFNMMKNEKSRKTKLERYGDENYVNKERISKSHLKNWNEHKDERIKKVKETKLERYGDENYVNSEKNKETLIKNYGSVQEAYNQNAIKTKQTKLERYGNEKYVNVEKSQQTKLERYGDKGYHNIEKQKQTNLEKYGFEFPTMNKEISIKISKSLKSKSIEEWNDIINKREETNFKLYGNRNYVNAEKIADSWNKKSREEIEEILYKTYSTKKEKYGDSHYFNADKVKSTNIDKFGVEYPAQSKKIKEKTKQTNLKKLGVEYPMQSKIVKSKLKENNLKKLEYAKSQNLYSTKDLSIMFNKTDTTITDIIKKLNINFHIENDTRDYIQSSDLPILEDYFAKTEMSGISYSEKQIVKFIRSIYDGGIIENSKKIIYPKELDVYIPEKKLAIEFDGLYWHDENHVENNYHLNKTLACNKKGIDLIHVFEDDWINGQDIVKSMIASRLGIYERKIFARKCEVKSIDCENAKSFFNENHLQGYAYADLYLALIYEGEVVQCICINKKGWHDGNVELTRMATKLNTQVVGGFSKLMKHVSDFMDYKSITSYIYRAWFNGKGYAESGFTVVKENPPSYSYIAEGKRVHKSYFRKEKIKHYFECGLLNHYDENETEHELMKSNYIYRIYDCGTIKVEYFKR